MDWNLVTAKLYFFNNKSTSVTYLNDELVSLYNLVAKYFAIITKGIFRAVSNIYNGFFFKKIVNDQNRNAAGM